MSSSKYTELLTKDPLPSFKIRHVDLHYTRETATVDKLFYHRDATVDGLQTEEPVFTFTYRYGNDFVRIRFFTCRMFVTRVEIKENE